VSRYSSSHGLVDGYIRPMFYRRSAWSSTSRTIRCAPPKRRVGMGGVSWSRGSQEWAIRASRSFRSSTHINVSLGRRNERPVHEQCARQAVRPILAGYDEAILLRERLRHEGSGETSSVCQQGSPLHSDFSLSSSRVITRDSVITLAREMG